jgi:hypothetical protein
MDDLGVPLLLETSIYDIDGVCSFERAIARGERKRGRALILASFWINLEGKPSKFGVNTVEPDVNRVSLGSDLN